MFVFHVLHKQGYKRDVTIYMYQMLKKEWTSRTILFGSFFPHFTLPFGVAT